MDFQKRKKKSVSEWWEGDSIEYRGKDEDDIFCMQRYTSV